MSNPIYNSPAEDASNKSQDSLIKFIHSIDEGFELLELIFDKQGNVLDFVFLEVNPAYEKQTGLKAADIIGKLKKEVAPASEQRWYDYAIKAAKTAKILSYEYYNDKVNGYFDTQFIPISTNQIAVIFKDITERKKAEEALRLSEERFEQMVEQSPVVFEVYDMQGYQIKVNDAYGKFWNIPKELTLGKYNILKSEQVRERDLLQYVERAYAGEIVNVPDYEYDASVEPSTGGLGRKRWLNAILYPLKDECGAVTGIVVLHQDITDRKKDEKALGESERRYRGLYNAVADGIIVVDCNGAISEVNEFACKIFGYSREEIKNSLIKPIWHAINEDGSPFPIENHPAMVTLKTGKSVRDVVMGVYLPNIGEYRWLIFNSEPMFNSQRGIESAVITFVDITDRKKMEGSLKESRKKYQDLIETTSDFIWEIDSQGKYTYCSPQIEKLFGVKPAEMIGKTPFDMTPPGAIQKALETFKGITNSSQPFYGLQTTACDRKGRLVFVETNGVPFFDDKGKLLGFRGISRDITERKTLEKQLQDNERMAAIGQTAGMVGHDLRNPLQSIIGEVYLAKSELDSLPDGENKSCLQESVQAIGEQVGYMDKIVSDLQTFVKPIEAKMEIINLKPVITALLAQTDFPKNIQASMQIDDKLIVNADAQLLKRVLINLVTNAVQAMPDGGELTIKAQTNDKKVQIIVEDTGTGIPEEIKSKIFTPLFTTKSKGQGFGLAVCKRVIEAQGGTINFESQEGKGTKFIIELPINSN